MPRPHPTGLPSIAGAILAGGKASRLGGTPKGLLRRPDSRTIIRHQLTELRAAGIDHVVIASNDEAYSAVEVQAVPDLIEGIGPLGGIQAAMSHFAGSFDATFFLPCDLPDISRDEIARIRDGFHASGVGVVAAAVGPFFIEPLCSVVHNARLDRLSLLVERGVRKPRQVWTDIGMKTVRFDDPAPFMNLNSPEDLARWRQEASSHDASPDETRT